MVRRIVITIFIALIFGWQLFHYAAHPNTLITLDVGQGLSVLYTDPSGWQLLYDGGPGGVVGSALGTALPIWDRTIDVIALSHPHADHSAGLVTVLDRYTVGAIWLSALASTDEITGEILARAQSKQIPVVVVSRGFTYLTPGGTTITALSPPSSFIDSPPPRAHATTPVLSITNSSTTILLTGDLDPEDEDGLVAFCSISQLCPSKVTVLQVAHHGSKYVTSTAFLNRFHPDIAIISAGTGNTYHHPHQETLDRLASTNATVMRTDILGSITVRLDHLPLNE